MLNISYRKVGGMRFLKIGRLNLSWSVSAEFSPIGSQPRVPKAKRYTSRQMSEQFARGRRAGAYAAKREAA